MIILGIIALVLVLVPYMIFSYGMVTYYYYYWFLLPIFNLPEISFIESVGLSLFIVMLIHGKGNSGDPDDDWKSEAGKLIKPWFILFIGWIFHRSFIL